MDPSTRLQALRMLALLPLLLFLPVVLASVLPSLRAFLLEDRSARARSIAQRAEPAALRRRR